MSKSGASNVINIKKIIVFIIFLVIGSFLGSNIKNYVKTYK
jgi:hypothetical protein